MSTADNTTLSVRQIRHGLFVKLLLVSRMCFWLGALWFVLGVFVDFVPGSEQGWFIIAAVLAAFGLLVPHRRYQIVALILFILSTAAAFAGHRRGIEYQRMLMHRRAAGPSLIYHH